MRWALTKHSEPTRVTTMGRQNIKHMSLCCLNSLEQFVFKTKRPRFCQEWNRHHQPLIKHAGQSYVIEHNSWITSGQLCKVGLFVFLNTHGDFSEKQENDVHAWDQGRCGICSCWVPMQRTKKEVWNNLCWAPHRSGSGHCRETLFS